MDSRENPPYLSQLSQDYPEVQTLLGNISFDTFDQYDEVIASPGIAMENVSENVNIIGDIELFAHRADAPVIGITGSNGKSTVTMLVARMLRGGGYQVKVGGNIGTPALDLLDGTPTDFYVLELSSFQLETTHSLRAASATVLNVSEDHMDRYDDLASYAKAKYRLCEGANYVAINRDERSDFFNPTRQKTESFGLDSPCSEHEFGVVELNGERYFAKGEQCLGRVADMTMQGDHNVSNMLAALALVSGAGVVLSEEVVEGGLSYPGLPHRCEIVANRNGVKWINDSKGTNVGATIAAIEGLSAPILLIAGGQGKDADFSPLAKAAEEKVTHSILFGEDADQLEQALTGYSHVHRVADLATAVECAAVLAQPNQTVLFSPACASFDMFKSFEHRGDAFRELVARLTDG